MWPELVLAVVEINDPMLLVAAAVFVLTFVGVCAVAYAVLGARRRKDDPTTWDVHASARLPMTRDTFERAAHAIAAAVSAPEVAPATHAKVEHLDGARRTFVSIYRTVFITLGLAGLVAGGLVLRSHTPANMNGLPGAIVVLLALGALLKGLVPGPAVKPIEPLDPDLLRQMRDKVSVRTMTVAPIAIKLGEDDTRRISEMLRRGAPPGEAWRAVYPDFDTLGDSEKRWLESMIANEFRDEKPGH